MKLGWTIGAVAFSWTACLMTFMLVVFAGGGYANNPSISKGIIKIFDLAMFVLPGLWAIAGVILLLAYFREWGASHYWWAASPLPFTIAFILWMLSLSPKA